jgi:hypothetical protein
VQVGRKVERVEKQRVGAPGSGQAACQDDADGAEARPHDKNEDAKDGRQVAT